MLPSRKALQTLRLTYDAWDAVWTIGGGITGLVGLYVAAEKWFLGLDRVFQVPLLLLVVGLFGVLGYKAQDWLRRPPRIEIKVLETFDTRVQLTVTNEAYPNDFFAQITRAVSLSDLSYNSTGSGHPAVPWYVRWDGTPDERIPLTRKETRPLLVGRLETVKDWIAEEPHRPYGKFVTCRPNGETVLWTSTRLDPVGEGPVIDLTELYDRPIFLSLRITQVSNGKHRDAIVTVKGIRVEDRVVQADVSLSMFKAKARP